MEHDDIEEVVEPADPIQEPKERLLAKVLFHVCIFSANRGNIHCFLLG